MARMHAILWCKAIGEPVEVTLERTASNERVVRYAPCGWRVTECLDEGAQCMGKECPLIPKRSPEEEIIEPD